MGDALVSEMSGDCEKGLNRHDGNDIHDTDESSSDPSTSKLATPGGQDRISSAKANNMTTTTANNNARPKAAKLSNRTNSQKPPETVVGVKGQDTGVEKEGASSSSRKSSRKEKPARKRGGSNLPGPGSPFESGVNTECVQLIRQLWNAHEEGIQFLKQIRTALCYLRGRLRQHENSFEQSLQEKRSSIGGEVKELEVEEWVKLEPFIDGLTTIADSFTDIENQYVILSGFQNQCKMTLFAKLKHAKLHVTHDRLSIIHGVQHLISTSLSFLSSPQPWTKIGAEEAEAFKLLQNVFQLSEVYNTVLEGSWSLSSSASVPSADSSDPSTAQGSEASLSQTQKPKSTNSVQVFIQIKAANRNDSALLRQSLKPWNGTRILQLLGKRRSLFTSPSLAKSIHALPSQQGGQEAVHERLESIFMEEEAGVEVIGKGFSNYPALLGGKSPVVKSTDNGEQRLSKKARSKVHSYFHQVLWTLSGEQAEDLVLWSSIVGIPLTLQRLDAFPKYLAALGSEPDSPLQAAFQTVATAIKTFSLLANWDERMRAGLEEAFRIRRPEHIALKSGLEPTQWATEIGAKFGQIVTTCVGMIDPLGPLRGRTEEEPLGNEAQMFFRLEASFVYFKAWVVKRAKVWLNGWAIPQFLAVSQRDPALLVRLIRSKETLLITRDFLLNNPDVSIRLSASHRKACVDDLKTAVDQVHRMPEELLLTVGPVCRTLSLATLQSYMPPTSHWRGLGLGHGAEKPSDYVNIFIGRVLEPVITAAVDLVPGPVQEGMGKQVVNAACDAWLQYILHKKVKFSEWGAVQLLRDFTAFREWIRTETELEKEARKAILQLEILRTCEGVAYLLLRSPGDVLGVGKKGSRRTRRVGPSTGSSVDSTPSPGEGEDGSTAEDDIPAEMYVPNQQMWLSLRLRRSYFPPFCC